MKPEINPELEVKSDWAKNWNGSIAIKVTAVTIWIILVLSFVITIPFLSSFEESSKKKYSWQSVLMQELIHEHSTAKRDKESLENAVKQLMLDSDIKYLAFNYHGSDLEFGETSESNYQLSSHIDDHPNNYDIEMVSEFPPLKRSVLIARVELGSAIVGFSVIFGLFLFWVNKSIVHAPFKEVIDLTQKISKGETSLRLGTARADEFGILARFLNAMLDTLESNQAALKKANAELVGEIEHREEALAASQQKSAFLANMSHEIRTPLSSIIGFTERIRFDKAKSPEEEKQMLDIVLQNGNHLLHLINDILDLSKVEANKLEVEETAFSIVRVVEHTRRLLADRAMEQGIELNIKYEFPIPANIHNDPIRTKQILLNLAGNAIRFTKQGSVTIELSYDAQQDDLVIDVKDTGIGMSENELANLFKPFSQADSSISRKYGGTGLGLTISKRLAELMGGDITVKSIKSLGSCFTCRIAAGFDQNNDELIYSLENSESSFNEYEQPVENLQLNGKVLLVEDTPEIQKLVTAYLEDYGINIDVADNGQQGVDYAMKNDYDLVLMDVQMPIMNGKQATKTLRANNYKQPIIALTADALTEHAEEFKEIGFTETLTKPIVINHLMSTIRDYLEGNNTSQQSAAPKVANTKEAPDNINDGMAHLSLKFLNRLPNYVHDMKTALESKKLSDAKAIAHQLKGLGGSFGYPEVSKIATEIEDLLKADNVNTAQVKLGEIEQFCIDAGVA